MTAACPRVRWHTLFSNAVTARVVGVEEVVIDADARKKLKVRGEEVACLHKPSPASPPHFNANPNLPLPSPVPLPPPPDVLGSPPGTGPGPSAAPRGTR